MSTRRSTRSVLSSDATVDVSREAGVASPSSTEAKTFTFDNITFYSTYAEMVTAKRQRNQNMLIQSGLLDAKAAIDASVAQQAAAKATSRGIKRSSAINEIKNAPRRKSGRLAGQTAPNLYVEHESAGRITLSGGDLVATEAEGIEYEPEYYKGRINDGSPLSIKEAVLKCENKWINEDSTVAADQFGDTLKSVVKEYGNGGKNSSPTTVAYNLQTDVDALSLDDEANVAKVVPDRIYSVVCHPSSQHLMVCAGDKQGYLGMWNVDQYNAEHDESTKKGKISHTDGVHLFKPHSRPVSALVWKNSGTKLLSSSYDGTVRSFDVEKQVFDEVFATYNDNEIYRNKIGYGLDNGYSSWVQCMELDSRHGNGGDCFFLSTSEGTVMHIDLRAKGNVTFNQKLSEKKINTVSLHPNGFTMATAGLDTTVKLWDIRKMKTSSKIPNQVAYQNAGKSVNSAFFSPSGKRIVTTTMSNNIDILEDAHLSSGIITAPKSRIRHDNHTGRWLCTFMAKWHPSASEECFVVGSMQKPRTVEVFNGTTGKLMRGIQGDALTAVASRCCFHPNSEKLIVVGGNSSGRITVAR